MMPRHAVVLVLAAGLLGCARRPEYPAGTVIDFSIQCVQQPWPGLPAAPLDLREAFCACIVEHAEARYDVEEFDRMWRAMVRDGQPGFADIAARCRSDLDRGALRVR